jgi:hypothetical protein
MCTKSIKEKKWWDTNHISLVPSRILANQNQPILECNLHLKGYFVVWCQDGQMVELHSWCKYANPWATPIIMRTLFFPIQTIVIGEPFVKRWISHVFIHYHVFQAFNTIAQKLNHIAMLNWPQSVGFYYEDCFPPS